jgi:homoisocitrate dehydrogenase
MIGQPTNQPTLCVILGDGIGREVIPVAVEVLRAALPDLQTVRAEAGWEVFRRTGAALPFWTLKAARDCGTVLFGAAASPSYPVEGYRSPIVALRRALDVFANLRPLRAWPVAGAHPALDLLLVRENTEGLYVGRERLEGDTAVSERIVTHEGAARVARMACRLAEASGRRLTIVHKANVLRVGDGLWRETCLSIATEFPQVQTDEELVDAAAYHLIRDPGRYQLLLCPNMYGDVLSDLAAALGGGLGMAPSISLGTQYAIAEPVHGAAPDIVGQNIANPLGAILSAALLARHCYSRPKVADAIEKAVERALASGRRTPDLAVPGDRTVGTKEMGQAVLANLALEG